MVIVRISIMMVMVRTLVTRLGTPCSGARAASLWAELSSGDHWTSVHAFYMAQHQHKTGGVMPLCFSPCLESVNLNSNLAIRCGDSYSIYSSSKQQLQPSSGDSYIIYSTGGQMQQQQSGYSGVERSHYSPCPQECHSTYSTLRRQQPGHNNSNGNSSYNTVKIVYTSGDRSTELTCLMDPSNSDNSAQYNITPNPMNVYSM